jgi:biopolymer transport protein ExbD
MAETSITTGKNRQGRGLHRSKKLSTKVDLTPMVDLGFLLITFFIVTTSWTSPKAMKLFLPAGKASTMPAGESTVLTIIPVSHQRIFYYQGDLAAALKTGGYGNTNYSYNHGIGEIIRQKQLVPHANPRFSRKDLMLVIKPTAEAGYQDIVSALDEVLINDLKHYAFVDLNDAEKQALKQLAIQ